MIEIKLQLSEHGRDSIVDVSSSGFADEGGQEAFEHREAFGVITASHSTWMLTVPQLAGYLISHCPRDEWRIRVLSGDVEVRRFEFEINPSPIKLRQRLSRYERTPVI